MAREFSFRAGRSALEMPVEVKTETDAFVGTSKNIGSGGLFVATDRRFEIGDRFALHFTLPDQPRSISVGAEVRWIREEEGRARGMGLRFVNPPVLAVVAIHEFLHKGSGAGN